MRFRKGSKVEVLNKSEVPAGSWVCAEIISGNGPSYHVKYDRSPVDMANAVEKVPRKAIKPCPPSVEGPRNWLPGDVVEVSDNSSWKLAAVSRVVGGNFFLVRFLGSAMEFRVHSSDIRLRQSWQDGTWVVIPKDSGKASDGKRPRSSKQGKFICQLSQQCFEVKNCAGDRHLTIENDDAFEEVPRVSIKGKKKRTLPVERCHGVSRKMIGVEKEGRRQRLVSRHALEWQEKGQSWRLVKLASMGPRW